MIAGAASGLGGRLPLLEQGCWLDFEGPCHEHDVVYAYIILTAANPKHVGEARQRDGNQEVRPESRDPFQERHTAIVAR